MFRISYLYDSGLIYFWRERYFWTKFQSDYLHIKSANFFQGGDFGHIQTNLITGLKMTQLQYSFYLYLTGLFIAVIIHVMKFLYCLILIYTNYC